MNIAVFTLSFWHDETMANTKANGLFGLFAWERRVRTIFNPCKMFIACGTYSNPKFNPAVESVTINSGMKYTKPYDVYYQQYCGCALTAMMAAALDIEDWDLLVLLDTDCLVGDVNFKTLLDEFMNRPETVLAPDWNGTPSGPFMAWKREGAAMYLHQRRRANIIDPSEKRPILLEDELAIIYRGKWWCPWPGMSMRQDHGFVVDKNPRRVLSWPFVRMPNPDIVDEYVKTQTSKLIHYEHRVN